MISPGAAAWFAVFAENLIRTSAVLSICLLLVWTARNRTAALRHALLSLFLIGLLLLPVCASFRFGWKTGLLPVRSAALDDRREEAPAVAFEGPYSGLRRLIAAPPARHAAAAAERPDAPVSPPWSGGILASCIPFVWWTGVAFFALRFTLGIVGARRLTLEAVEVNDASWRALLAGFLAALGIRRRVRLKSHAAVGVPVAWGLLRPVILIPGGHEEWTNDQRSSALLHELCHIKRADLLIMFLVRLSLAVFWFNPLCWIAARRLKQEQERACDELVLMAGIKPSAYADALLYFKRTAGFGRNVPAVFLGLFGSCSFQDRLTAILRQKLTLEEVTMKTKIMLAIAVLFAVSVIGLARPSQSDGPGLAAQAAAAAQPGPQGQGDQAKKVEAQKVPADQKKAERKRDIVVIDRAGEQKTLAIELKEGAGQKIQAEGPLVFKKDKEGRLTLQDRNGKEVEGLEGKEIVLVKPGDLVGLDKARVLKVIQGTEAQGAVAVEVSPRVRVLKRAKSGDGVVEVIVPKNEAVARAIRIRKDEQLTEAQKEKIKVLREKLKQDTSIRTAEIREAIKELRAERLKLGTDGKPVTFRLVRPRAVITRDGKTVAVEGGSPKGLTSVMTFDGNAATIKFDFDSGAAGREAYERVVAKVKQVLPEGCSLAPEFNESTGAAALRITAPGTEKISRDLIKKILGAIKEDTKSPE